MGRFGLSQVIPFYLLDKFQASTTQISMFFSIGLMVVWLIAQIPGGILADRYNRTKLLLVCYGTIPFLYLLWPMIHHYRLLLLLQMMLNLLFILAMPASTALLMDLVDEQTRGVASGLEQLSRTMGMNLVGPVVYGFLWETWGITSPFYMASLLFFLTIPLIVLLKAQR
jgi:MFS family permease